MSILVKDGVLKISGAEDKLRQKGREVPKFLKDYTLIDIETTGLVPYRYRVTELGGIKVRNNEIVDQYSHLTAYSGDNSVPKFITQLNGITEEKIVNEGVPVDEAIHDFRNFIGDDIIIGYNVNFDLNFVYDLSKKFGESKLSNNYVDVLRFARVYFPKKHNRLLDVMQRLGIAQVEQHRGLDDSIDTKKVYDIFRDNFTSGMLEEVKGKIKDYDLLNDHLNPWEISFRNPVFNKRVVFSGNLKMNVEEAQRMAVNLGGKVEEEVTPETDLLIVGDHDFFNKNNAALQNANDYNRQGAKIRRWSESFFLSALDEWARS